MIYVGQSSVYSSKIIKASGLLSDTKILLHAWDVRFSPEVNVKAACERNIFGKASRSRVRAVLTIFRQRYLSDPQVLRALVRLVKSGVSASVVDKILYFHAVQSDRLLHDVVTEVIRPLYEQGIRDVGRHQVVQTIRRWCDEGKTVGNWSHETTERVAQGVLATLRDFGIVQGAARKRIAEPHLPVAAFAYVAFFLGRQVRSGRRLLHHPEWQVFLLSEPAVERLFLEAHQERFLQYHAAGSTIRVDFPARTLEEYADVIAQRTD